MLCNLLPCCRFEFRPKEFRALCQLRPQGLCHMSPSQGQRDEVGLVCGLNSFDVNTSDIFHTFFIRKKWRVRRFHIIDRVSQKSHPLLIGNRNETIRYYYSSSRQLNLSICNLDSHTLHLKIVQQTPEIRTCKVKIYSAPETRGFVNWPRHYLISQAYCKGISTLNFSFFF